MTTTKQTPYKMIDAEASVMLRQVIIERKQRIEDLWGAMNPDKLRARERLEHLIIELGMDPADFTNL